MIIKRNVKLIIDDVVEVEIVEATCDICGDDCMKPLHDSDDPNEEILKSFEGM